MKSKLRELLEAASPGPWRFANITRDNVRDGAVIGPDDVHVLNCYGERFQEDGKLAAAAPALAAVVLTLSEALWGVCEAGELEELVANGEKGWQYIDAKIELRTITEALAAVEELEL